MFELLQEMLNSLDFFTDGNSSVNTDASGSKPPKGDSEICKRLTDQVIEMQKNSTLNPVSTIEQVDDEGRKHIAVAGGVKILLVGVFRFQRRHRLLVRNNLYDIMARLPVG